jgi:hypothetical protein
MTFRLPTDKNNLRNSTLDRRSNRCRSERSGVNLARVRRAGPPRSNGFIERAQSTASIFAPWRNARPIKL